MVVDTPPLLGVSYFLTQTTFKSRGNEMAKPRLPYLRTDLKLSLPAAVVAEVDLLLEDPLTRKPRYGAKSRLITALLKDWIARTKGDSGEPIPTLEELQTS